MSSPGVIEGFYRQKKKGKGASKSTKPSALASSKRSDKVAGGATFGAAGGATLGDGGCQTLDNPHLQTQGGHERAEEEVEERLRQFDMDMRYGPCLGLTRLQRWERAAAMGLNPPANVRAALSHASVECLWEGRV